MRTEYAGEVDMPVSFKGHWEDEIWPITESPEFQSCTIVITDPEKVVGGDYDVGTGTYTPITDEGIVYEGRARHIPIRTGTHQGGEAQANSTTIRPVRFQIPKDSEPFYIRKGLTIRITQADRNPSLVGRIAKVGDDFQGSSAATRTIHASMDIDAGGPDGN